MGGVQLTAMIQARQRLASGYPTDV